MRKFLALALLFLASSFVLAQDGRTRIDYYNKSSQTVRMLIRQSSLYRRRNAWRLLH